MPVWRTWACLNRRCKHQFNAQADFPPCPRCGGLRVNWVPQPFAIKSERTKMGDWAAKSLEEQARAGGMTNLQSPRRDERMAPKVSVQGQKMGPMDYEPVKGWKVTLPAMQAMCAPTGLTAPLKNKDYQFMDRVAPRTPGFSDPTPVIEASHRPEGK